MKTVKFVIIFLIFSIYGCTPFYVATNKKAEQYPQKTKASFIVEKDRGTKEKTLVVLSLSGGGSRAAYFSAEVMLALEEVFDEINILKEVDIISSVSGGSLPAAYYVISKDDESDTVVSNREWKKKTVRKLMSRRYKTRWFFSWLLPSSFIRYWFTAYDRSDLMAQVLSDNLFDKRPFGLPLKFKDINPERPYIILNSTNGTTGEFSLPYTFTQESFKKINSDINEYEIARAVMATAAFPAAFNYMTLENHKEKGKFLHVFDGGNSDNLGLLSVEEILEKNKKNYKNIVVILVDAYTPTKGVSPSDYDGRKLLDYAVDFNFIDSMNSLLESNRKGLIKNFTESNILNSFNAYVFYHIKFGNVSKDELRKDLYSIKTDFNISKPYTKNIENAVSELITKDNKCLVKIRDILEGEKNYKVKYCTWCTGGQCSSENSL